MTIALIISFLVLLYRTYERSVKMHLDNSDQFYPKLLNLPPCA